eukprot:6219270-Prymnesium_polylepis.1
MLVAAHSKGTSSTTEFANSMAFTVSGLDGIGTPAAHHKHEKCVLELRLETDGEVFKFVSLIVNS